MKFPAMVSMLLFAQHGAIACVGCRTPEVTSTEEPQTVLAGIAFSWSVLTMLGIVIVVVTGLGFYIAQTCRRVDRENISR